MGIQGNMSPNAIIEVWEITEDIFKKHNISIARNALESLVKEEQLNSLLQELNAAVGSSIATCIEGG